MKRLIIDRRRPKRSPWSTFLAVAAFVAFLIACLILGHLMNAAYIRWVVSGDAP